MRIQNELEQMNARTVSAGMMKAELLEWDDIRHIKIWADLSHIVLNIREAKALREFLKQIIKE